MGLLRSLGGGVILAYLAIVLAIEFMYLILRSLDAQAGEVDRVGTHIGNLSVFIEMLCHHHGLRHGESEFAGRLLLEGRGGEGRCR